MKIHEVKSGDTLASISKLFGLSVDEVKLLNGLEDSNLKPGQLLVVSK
jgi:LysM repeat protein